MSTPATPAGETPPQDPPETLNAPSPAEGSPSETPPMPKPQETPPNPSPRAAEAVLKGKKTELDPETKRRQVETAEAEDEATRGRKAPAKTPETSPNPHATDPEKAKEVKDGWFSGGLTFFD